MPHAQIGINPEGLAVRSFEELHEPIDPRFSLSSRPDAEQLEEGLSRQLGDFFHREEHLTSDLEKSKDPQILREELLYVEFEKGDKRNPINFSSYKKWAIALTACLFTLLSSTSASTYSMGFPSMVQDLQCTEFQANIGISLFPLGFGIVPLVSASFSEEFGRQPLYIVSTIGFVLMHLMVGFAKNIQTVIVGRLLAGAFGSTGATMVGGTIADLFLPHERGMPMSIFAVGAVAGTGLGPVVAGWVEMNPHLQWRWIQYLHSITTAAYLVLVPLIMTETRASILLTRLAKKLRKETGDLRYRARVEDERASLRTLIYISCTRPVYLLLTEPLVLSFSIWLGFMWGILYCIIESVGPIFKTLHGFNQGEEGTAFLGVVLGAILGFATNFYQESLYQKYFNKKGPEARLYSACAAAIMFPVGMLIYAWSSFPWVHWIALECGLTIFMWAAFIIYLAVFTYLADCYGPYASSALAGQSLLRNLMAMAFPLFTAQMFSRLTYKWANTIFGCIGVLIIPLPFVLYFYGPDIRARSKFSRAVMEVAP